MHKTGVRQINFSQRLFIELGTSLLLETEDSSDPADGELIGMHVGDYLIIRLLQNSWVDHPSSNGEKYLNVKYLRSGEIFGFRSRVVLALDVPDSILFIDYPEEVTSCDIRSEKRVDCFFPVTLLLGETILDGTICNIHFDGCMCHIERCSETDVIAKGSAVLTLPLATHSELTIRGDVCNIRKTDSVIVLGISFRKLDAFSKAALRTAIPELNIWN